MDNSVTGNKSSPPKNNTNEPAEQNIDKHSSDECEIIDNDKSPKLDSRISDALDDSAHLEQAIRKINDNGNKMDKLSYQICSTSSPFSFEKNISEMHKYLEKLDQSQSILSTPDTGAKEVSISEKTLNVPSEAALLEFERLRKEFKQQIDALRQELMSKIEAKMSNGANDVRAVSGTNYWNGDESSSKIGSFIEESENRQLAECRNIIENTPVLRGSLPCKTKRGLRENTEKDLSDNVINLSEDLSTLEASVEHCNAFAETRDKPEADNESSKNTAHDLDLTLKREEMEVRQIDSLQMTRWVEELDKLSHRNRAKDESKPAFDQRTKSALPGLFIALFIVLTLFGLVAFFFASLDAQIEQRQKVESELKLAQQNLEGMRRDKDKAENELKRNLDELAHYKAKSQLEMEKLRNSRYDEIKQRRKAESERAKAESELKLAQENLERLRLDNEKAENEAEKGKKCSECLRKNLDTEIKRRAKAEGELKLAQENLEGMRLDKEKEEYAPTRSAQVYWLYFTLALLPLLIGFILGKEILLFCICLWVYLSLCCFIGVSVGIYLGVPWYYSTVFIMSLAITAFDYSSTSN